MCEPAAPPSFHPPFSFPSSRLLHFSSCPAADVEAGSLPSAAGQVNISVLLTGDSVQHRSHFCFCLPTLDMLLVALRVLSCDKFLCLKVPVSAKSVRLQERIGPSVTHEINICWIRAERGRKTGRGTKNSQMGRRKGNLPQKYTKSTMTSCVCASNS